MHGARTTIEGVVSSEKDGRKLSLLIKGDINPIIREVAKLDLDDIAFEQSHLEDFFLDFYRVDQGD